MAGSIRGNIRFDTHGVWTERNEAYVPRTLEQIFPV